MRPSTSPIRSLLGKRDFYAGGLMLLLGLGIALKGATYRPGTLMHMGPGFMPTVLGVLLGLAGGGAYAWNQRQRDERLSSSTFLLSAAFTRASVLEP